MTKIGFLLILNVAAAAAQTPNGYVFVAPGGVTSYGSTSMTVHLGAGVDAIVAKGLGFNVELGALGPRQEFSAALGVFSPGATYYFRHARELKVEPFINGGYTLMFRNGHENLFYAGGGVNYWFAKKIGLRFEVRDHVYPRYEVSNFWGVRFGVAFR